MKLLFLKNNAHYTQRNETHKKRVHRMTSSPLSCFGLPPYGDCTYSTAGSSGDYRFLPPYGDCIRMTTPKYPVMELSSPYGDGILSSRFAGCFYAFSPPYGDCTSRGRYYANEFELSPPYGDCTLNISQNTAKLKSRMARKYSLYYNDVLLR